MDHDFKVEIMLSGFGSRSSSGNDNEENYLSHRIQRYTFHASKEETAVLDQELQKRPFSCAQRFRANKNRQKIKGSRI